MRWLARSLMIVGVPGVGASYAWGQQALPPLLRQQTTAPEEEDLATRPSALLRIPALGPTLAPAYPGLSNYPLELLSLLMSPLERHLNLMPTIAISKEFNDNIFVNNDRKQYDFITGFAPGIMALVNRPRFQAAAGFTNTAELFARGNSANDAFAQQNLVAGMIWEPTPLVTLTLADTFLRDQNPSATAGGFALNGQGGLSNLLNPAVGWQLGPQTRLDLGAIYSILRFEGQGSGIDSDTYALTSNLSHAFTPRLVGMAGYNFTYLDLRSGHGDNATSHNPTLGFMFRLTPTLRSAPTAVRRSPIWATRISSRPRSAPGSRSASRSAPWSPTTVAPSAWPAGSAARRTTRPCRRPYRVNPYITVFGGYSFLLYRVGRFSTTQTFDADQNRVKFGVQFGYPFAFDLGG